jgi:hypothetical protein
MTTYNGWTNYATWRVNLEVFDGLYLTDFTDEDAEDINTYNLSKDLKSYAEEMVLANISTSIYERNIACDFALAFLSDVNWDEIAEHLVEAVEA